MTPVRYRSAYVAASRAFTTAPPERRGGELEMVLRAGSKERRQARLRTCIGLRWAWLPVRGRSGMRARRFGRGRGG
jgi:hypothetical protein